MQICALSLAGGIYCGEGFAPTRLNIADDPARDVSLREPCGTSFLEHLPDSAKLPFACVRLRRFAANWLRLAILLTFCDPASALQPGAYFSSDAPSDIWSGLFPATCERTEACEPSHFFLAPACSGACLVILTVFACFLAAITACVACKCTCAACLHCKCRRSSRTPRKLTPPKIFWVGFRVGLPVLLSHGCLATRTPAYNRRALERANLLLQTGRGVLPKTDSNRQVRLADLARWLDATTDYTLEALLEANGLEAETVNKLVVEFGQYLFSSGRPYGHFSELINAISSARPVLRRQLGGAWDLAYNSMAFEPHVHHMLAWTRPSGDANHLSSLGMDNRPFRSCGRRSCDCVPKASCAAF